MTGQTPQDYTENMAKMKESKQGFTLIKQASRFSQSGDDARLAQRVVRRTADGSIAPDRGFMTNLASNVLSPASKP
jgi:hypothetical protein